MRAAGEAQLHSYWEKPEEQRQGLQPLQQQDGVGHRLLEGDRACLDYCVGPWLQEVKPLPALQAVSWLVTVLRFGWLLLVLLLLLLRDLALHLSLLPVPPSALQAAQELDSIALTVLSAALRSQCVRLPGNALAAALDDLPLPPHAWASSTLQCFSYGAASSGCEEHVDKRLLTLIHAPGQPGLQVGFAKWCGVWVVVCGWWCVRERCRMGAAAAWSSAQLHVPWAPVHLSVCTVPPPPTPFIPYTHHHHLPPPRRCAAVAAPGLMCRWLTGSCWCWQGAA